MAKFMMTFAILGALAASAAGAQDAAEIPGLEAWYKVDSLHARLRHGADVYTWEDSTPNRHDLVFDEKSEPAKFNALILNDLPIVQIQRSNLFKVSQPFELDDHTIFLVSLATSSERALFRSDTDDNRGVILFHNSQSHQFRNGSRGQVVSYNARSKLKKPYSITVLGRDSGVLTASVDGVDLSSNASFEDPIRVGVFFDVAITKFVRRDGAGLHIAEMLFYNRYLDQDERESVINYLSEKYAIPVDLTPPGLAAIQKSDVRVRLLSSAPTNLNDPLVPVSWNGQEQVGAPFTIDPESDGTAIVCEQDGTQARVSVKLPIRTRVEDVGLRLLILKSGETYHPEEAATGKFEDIQGTWVTTLELDTTIKLDAGDYIEIITVRTGAEGTVTVEPGLAELIVATPN